MGRKLYVGNLTYDATEDMVRSKFAEHGIVDSVNLIADRDTGRSKGFAFVEMSTNAEAGRAIAELNGADLNGRPMKVNEAKPQEKRPGSGRGRW